MFRAPEVILEGAFSGEGVMWQKHEVRTWRGLDPTQIIYFQLLAQSLVPRGYSINVYGMAELSLFQ